MRQDPIRSCVGCRIKKKKQELIRFTIRNGRLFIDNKSEYGGKGWYLCYNIKCSEKIMRTGKLKGAGSVSRDELRRILRESELEELSECQRK